jgi:hypothetical protein
MENFLRLFPLFSVFSPPHDVWLTANVKTRTYKQVEAAKRRAELAAANLIGDESRADEFADMSVEEYARIRGITIQNPKKGALKMPSRIKQLEEELEAANSRIEELEAEREDILDVLGVEIVDEEDEGPSDEDED